MRRIWTDNGNVFIEDSLDGQRYVDMLTVTEEWPMGKCTSFLSKTMNRTFQAVRDGTY